MAEAECKDLLQKYPNSKFAPDGTKMLLATQEVLADAEMKVGQYYAKKGGNGYYASASRLNALVDQYPVYSQADEALWIAADDYNQMGNRYENKQAEMYTRIVRDYPLSARAEDAKAQLKAMNRPVPEADPVAEARMKYELANRVKPGLMSRLWSPFGGRPETYAAAKSGTPQMETFRPATPLDVPVTASGQQTTNEVTIGPIANSDILDKAPDARTGAAGTATPATPAAGDATGAATAPAADASKTDAATTASGTATPAAGTAPTAPANAPAAAAISSKKAKPPKVVAAKKRPRPAATTTTKKKSAAPPAQATPPPQTTAPAGGAAQAPAQAPQQ
jgi:outer membrane protein assembly factor BamD